ncbi:MAG: efflux RND transporter periplasmic adaptor subunit [Alphaproteobacteria bacterium]
MHSRQRTLIVFCVAFLAVAASAAAEPAPADQPAAGPPPGGQPAAGASEWTVAAHEIADRKAVFATVESVDVTQARARIQGTVDNLTVDEGSKVAAGEQIAVVRDPKLGPRLATVDAKIESLKAERKLAQLEFDRAAELRRKETATQARVDAARAQLDVVVANIAAVTAERSVIAQEQAEGAVLAPESGRVLKVHVTERSVVLPGDVIATIAVDRYVLRLHLPERHARFIKEGDGVQVGARGLGPGTETLGEGTIRQVYPEMQEGRVVADVAVAGLGDFFVGERVRVYVETGKRQAIVVPESFLSRRFGLTYARLRDGGDVVVQTGLPAEGGIQVLSGLKPGDVLVKP